MVLLSRIFLSSRKPLADIFHCYRQIRTGGTCCLAETFVQIHTCTVKGLQMAEQSDGCSCGENIIDILCKEKETAKKDDGRLLLDRCSSKYWHTQ